MVQSPESPFSQSKSSSLDCNSIQSGDWPDRQAEIQTKAKMLLLKEPRRTATERTVTPRGLSGASMNFPCTGQKGPLSPPSCIDEGHDTLSVYVLRLPEVIKHQLILNCNLITAAQFNG